MNDITLVIPAKNEAESLPDVLNELSDYNINKVIVLPPDDTKTLKAIEKFNCKILKQEGIGFGNALIQGINSVETKYFCIFNADGSFNPKYLNKLRQKLSLDYDFVFCSRYESGGGSEDDTLLTYIGNRIFTGICNLLFKLKITDVLFTYVMGSTKAFKTLDMKFNDFSFCVELPIKAARNKMLIASSDSYELKRIAGKKKVNEFRDGIKILFYMIKLFFK